jgi:hypothetical protein
MSLPAQTLGPPELWVKNLATAFQTTAASLLEERGAMQGLSR